MKRIEKKSPERFIYQNEKMKVLIFDTETTGLPNKKDKRLSAQPYVIQFAWIVVDMNDDWSYEELSRINQFIKPPIPIPYQSSEVHWIYDWDVINCWPFEDYAKTIQYYLNKPDIIVWHNIKFDNLMMKNEFERLKVDWKPYDFIPQWEICTMEASRYYCNLPWRSPKAKKPKAPKLQELVKKTCWTYFTGAHDAMVDVEWTLKAFSKLVEKWVVKPEKKEELMLF